MLGTLCGCSQYLQVLHTDLDEYVTLNIGRVPGKYLLGEHIIFWTAIYKKKKKVFNTWCNRVFLPFLHLAFQILNTV